MRPYDPNKQQQRSAAGAGGADGSSINDMSIQMTTAPSPMQLPHNSNNRKAPPLYQKTTKHSSSANTSSFVVIYIWLALLSVLTIWIFMRHPTPAEMTAPPPGGAVDVPMVAAAAAPRGATADTEETIHTYPFNVYDDTANRIVRYPQTGGIPHLDWKRVRNFRACCKDDDNLRCFSTEEVALRRDPVRSSQGLSDVYLEIRQQSTHQQQNDENWRPIGSRGARCQLIWTACKVKVES